MTHEDSTRLDRANVENPKTMNDDNDEAKLTLKSHGFDGGTTGNYTLQLRPISRTIATIKLFK